MMAGGMLTTKDDWTLQGRGSQGPLIVQPGRFPEGWMIKAVLLNGEDVSDSGIPTRSGERLDGLQIVLTNRLTRVNGTVSTGLGQPARDYVAVVFPEEAALWRAFTRRIRSETPDQQGRFEMKSLPPGHYLAVALRRHRGRAAVRSGVPRVACASGRRRSTCSKARRRRLTLKLTVRQ